MLKGILAISGQSGLFRLVSQTKNAIIVESLIDGKRFPAYASSKVSALEDISIYTEEGDLKLSEIFLRMQQKSTQTDVPDSKATAQAMKAYFEEIVPDYDKDRVYISDIKKVIIWYHMLNSHQLIKETVEPSEN